MPSGQFHTIPLDDIIVDREGRQRRELTDIDVLADSIRRLGLIHPPVVTREHVLVAGERRVTALRTLGWTHCPVQYVDEVEPLALQAIELEENIKRVDLPWQEQTAAIQAYHELLSSTNPGWTQEQTGEALGLAGRTVSDYLRVAKELEAKPELAKAGKFTEARNIVLRREARRTDEALTQLRGTTAPPKAEWSPILTADFNEWAPTYDGPRFNFLHCDFPYGIGASNFQQGSSVASFGGYKDEAAVYFQLLETLANNLDRLCLDSCHIMFWFSMKYYTETQRFFAKETNFVLDPFPLVWHKSDNDGLLPDPRRGPRRTYETCLFGSRGDRFIASPVANSYSAPTARESHMSEKPEPVLRHFFRMFVDEHTRMLDPTCGSGSALRAAESLNAQHILGLEVNDDFASRARLALTQSRRLRATASAASAGGPQVRPEQATA